MARCGAFGWLVLGVLACASPSFALDEKACRLESRSLPAAFARCATLTVAEDLADPDGPALPLFVARIESSSATPRPDPLVLISGGPGQSTVDLYLQLRSAFAPVRRDRDIILLDQRGTGRSADGLSCEVPDDMELETAAAELLAGVVDDCLAGFARDPRQFTTSVAVEDLERLRQELGVEQWNLYGVSYGTRVVQHYLRRFPDRVRAAILDGVVPAELVLGLDIAANAQAALDAIFERCARNAGCADRFEALDQKFDAVLERLAAGSIDLRVNDPSSGEPADFVFTASHMQAVVRLMSYSAPTAALLPLVIDNAYNGNYGPLAAQAQIVIQGVADAIGFAMHNSVVCSEDVPFFGDMASVQRGVQGGSPYLGTAIVDALGIICRRWPAGVLDENFKAPVESDRPVLLLSGELDPVTPPAYAERVMANGLTNAAHLIGRGQGHGLAAVGCVPRLMRSFLNAPAPEDLGAECLAAEPPMPFFLSFQGPAP